jgi:Zn-dependent M28 family amino/carboxypeptidase
MRRVLLLAIPAIAIHAIAHAQAGPTAPRFSADAIRAHVTFLADDLLAGRKTGTPGHEIAARYVAAQFNAYGLKPGGTDGWYQRITFQHTDRGAQRGAVTISGPGGDHRWEHGTEVVVGLNPNELHLDVSAPFVFVGFGEDNARLGVNDYRGLDAKGKIVVVLRGYPKGMPSEEGAYLNDVRAEVAQRHGAIGLVTVDTLLSAHTFPWKMFLRYADEPYNDWVQPDGKVHQDAPGIRARAALNTPAAEAIFAGAPRTLESLLKEADKPGGRPKGFALKTQGRIQSDGVATQVTSPNVVGILPGSDPAHVNEYVVLSAHLDHLGTRPTRADDKPDTDRIYNGALDNAAGVATMLEVARAAATSPDRPRRSLLFLASTGEEDGLLGADYFARYPTVPINQVTGNVDLDMPVLLYTFTDVIGSGADHSSIGPMIAAALKPMGIVLAPDPEPEQGYFTRSDNYMFVRQGVPALALGTGFANGGEKFTKAYRDSDYHEPSDDLHQKIDWESGARYAEVNYRITRAMADSEEPTRWNEGDFFGDAFAPNAPRHLTRK